MIKGFLAGIAAYGRAFRLISALRLWSYFFIPALISLLLAAIIFGSAWYLGDNIGQSISNWYPWERGRLTVEKISTVFGGLLVAALGLMLYKNLVMALASPFMSKLSERIEKQLNPSYQPAAFSSTRMFNEIMRGLRIAFRNVTRELFFTLILLLLGLIPIFTLFVPVAIFLVQAYYAGFGSMDYTLERHFKRRSSIQFVKDNRGLAMGNGSVFVLLLFTGIGFLFALPFSTVAATPEVLKRMGE